MTSTLRAEVDLGLLPPKAAISGNLDSQSVLLLLASYRDPICGYTVMEAFEQATFPDRVVVGIVEQHGKGDPRCADEYCRLALEKGKPCRRKQVLEPAVVIFRRSFSTWPPHLPSLLFCVCAHVRHYIHNLVRNIISRESFIQCPSTHFCFPCFHRPRTFIAAPMCFCFHSYQQGLYFSTLTVTY